MKAVFTFALLLTFLAEVISPAAFQNKRAQSKGEITEITLERRGCHGVCPVYKVVLRKEGMSEYVGEPSAGREGRYQAKIFPYDFERLAKLAESIRYFNLKSKYYLSGNSPGPFATTSIVHGHVRKTIEDDEGAIPIELWGFELTIDAVVETRMPWDKIGDK